MAKAVILSSTKCEMDYGYMRFTTPSGMSMILFSIVGDLVVMSLDQSDHIVQCDGVDAARLDQELRRFAADKKRYAPSLLATINLN